MTYDILFVPRRPGQAWDEALDAAEGSDVLTVDIGPERLAQWERIVTALRRRLGEVDVSAAPDMREATATDGSGLQVSLFPDEAAVSFPYWERPDRAAFHDLVVDVVGLVESETGLQAWDAQADHPFDGQVHDAAGLEAARGLTADPALAGAAAGPDLAEGPSDSGAPAEVLPDTVAASEPVTPPDPAAAPAEPTRAEELARDRTRALRYLVIGLVVVAGALLLRTTGETSVLSGLAIAIGVFDIVIGAALWRSWRRRSQEQS